MRGRLSLTMVIVLLVAAAAAAFVGFGVWHATSNTPAFAGAGYVLRSDSTQVEQLSFAAGSTYSDTLSGEVKFSGSDGNSYTVSRESFVHLDSGMMALSDGVLLDFADLTDNFINNYFLSSGVVISKSGSTYNAQTDAGNMQFGEHLWKLSDNSYVIVSPTLKVNLNTNGEVHTVSDYVQVTMSRDGIAYLVTPENLWMTISESSYIETEGGVKVYPVSQIVEDSSYKLSLAKLSVSADDAIVLTEGETRRQIVPELNITGVDGEDGVDGVKGADGAAGTAGEDGGKGENGGEGDEGEGGSQGGGGSQGTGGNTGAQGLDAVMDSSSNTALPVMTITDWRVTAESLKGTITIADKGGMLNAISSVSSQYPGSVTITKVSTGEVINCYEAEVTSGTYGKIDNSNPGFEKMYTLGQIGFMTDGNVLEPNTEYKLSVKAYYRFENEGMELIYNREFISRTFFTDSAGVNLNYASATTNSITLTANTTDDYADGLKQVQVFLLTSEQNKAITAAGIENASVDYVKKIVLEDGSFSEEKLTNTLEMKGLDPNKSYIARVYVTNTDGLKVLTNQELEVKTLKRAPVVQLDSDGDVQVPTVDYNRLTGGFEVYLPAITDQDSGIVSYTYTAYSVDNIGTVLTKEYSRTVSAGTGEPVVFHLSSGTNYRFGVEMVFDDNEKEVEYDLGLSEVIKAEGDTMPRVSLTPNEVSGMEYNSYTGILRIDLGSKSTLVVDNPQKPIVVELIADSLSGTGKRLELYQGAGSVNVAGVGVDAMGTMRIERAGTNYVDIKVELKNLYKDTNYAIVVSGWLNLGDNNGSQNRNIGTVTFKTYDTVTLVANYTDVKSDDGASLAQMLSLSVANDTETTEQRRAYAQQQLTGGGTASTEPCGAVTVVLYYGVGAGKQQLAQQTFSEKSELEQLFGTGLLLTEASFENPPIDAGSSYTLTVTQVADSSYDNDDLDYINYYEDILNASGTTSGVTQPPDLLPKPYEGVKATPILNKDVGTYGGKVSTILPDDAVVGYTLESTYDNVQRIGTKITYYAYEYRAYLNAREKFGTSLEYDLSRTPCMQMEPLMIMSQSISSASDSVPKVAILFGGTKNDEKDPAAGAAKPAFYNGYTVYYSGDAGYSDKQLSLGMGRGFRFVFAYEVEYNASAGTEGGSGNIKLYPYAHAKYATFRQQYGTVKVGEVTYGNIYLLTSNVMDAPLILPDFHVYVNQKTNSNAVGAVGDYETGQIELHYTWRDREAQNNPDDIRAAMVYTSSTADRQTYITYDTFQGGDSTATQFIGQESDKVSDNWYKISLPYTHNANEETWLEPTLNISPYRLDYTELVPNDTSVKDMTLGPIRVEWNWGSYVDTTISASNNGDGKGVYVTKTDYTADNYIMFSLKGTNVASVAERAVALGLTFTVKEESGNGASKSFILPIVYDDANMPAVKVMTSQLGSAFRNKEYTVHSLKLYYDTGEQGWKYLQENQETQNLYYTLQRDDGKGRYTYETSSSLDTVPGSGSLFKAVTDDVAAALRTTIHASKHASDVKYSLLKTTALTGDGGVGGTSFLYPIETGVRTDSEPALETVGKELLVPKRIAVSSLMFEGKAESTDGAMTSMTPTVMYDTQEVTGTTYRLKGITINGMEPSTEDKSTWVILRIYSNSNSANNFSSSNIVKQKYVKLLENGTLEGEDAAYFTALNVGGSYWFTIGYTNPISGEPQLLIKENNAQRMVIYFSTSDKTVIYINEQSYKLNGYLDKFVTGKFSITPEVGQIVRYDVYSTEQKAKTGGTADVMTYEHMVENNLISTPNVLAAKDNGYTLQLKPQAARSAIKPGNTYWLRITSHEQEANGTLREAGYAVRSFAVDKVQGYGALFYIQEASSESIQFGVTITDPQYALMANDSDGAKYAVRFTDQAGNLIPTIYDDELYPAFGVGTLVKNFTLSTDNIQAAYTKLSITEETQYRMYVYAVPDEESVGQIVLEDGQDPLTYSDLLANNGEEFIKIIDSFWNADLTNVANKDSVEQKLLIGEKIQYTTNENNWLLNQNNIYPTRASAGTIRINFAESINLVTKEDATDPESDDVHIFNQIDWQLWGIVSASKEPIKIGGTITDPEGLIKVGEDTEGSSFYFDIPADLEQGHYTIELKLRTTVGAGDYVGITIISGV